MGNVPYVSAWRGNSGEFGTEDSAHRELDAAGKLKRQTARQDLKEKNYVDPERRPIFLQVLPQI
jgi:hypothetical protein